MLDQLGPKGVAEIVQADLTYPSLRKYGDEGAMIEIVRVEYSAIWRGEDGVG